MALSVLERHKIIKYVVPLFDVTAWSGFTNQPANDGVEVISNNAGDTGLLTIFGTTTGTGALVHETISLNGTTPVSTVKTNWGNILGAFLGDVTGQNITPAVGTITIREASANATITTLTANKISTGMVGFSLPGLNATYIQVSGNLYLKNNLAATVANGYPFASAEKLPITGSSEIDTLISDVSAATAKLVVWGSW